MNNRTVSYNGGYWIVETSGRQSHYKANFKFVQGRDDAAILDLYHSEARRIMLARHRMEDIRAILRENNPEMLAEIEGIDS